MTDQFCGAHKNVYLNHMNHGVPVPLPVWSRPSLGSPTRPANSTITDNYLGDTKNYWLPRHKHASCAIFEQVNFTEACTRAVCSRRDKLRS